MPVRLPFNEVVEVLVGAVWTAIPAQGVRIDESVKERITGFSFSVAKTAEVATATWDALTLNAQVRITQTVGSMTDSFTGRITKRPRRRVATTPLLEIEGQDETAIAAQRRFIDVWPKAGVKTDVQILGDAWTRYGPAGIDLTGITATGVAVDAISSNLDTLFEFTEELARRTGRAWRVRNNKLEYWEPQNEVFPIVLDQDDNIIKDSLVIDEELPQVANVAFVPAKVRVVDFEDVQPSRAGQAQYLLQYQPLVRQFESGGETVYIDEPPVVYLGGVQQTVAEDGSADAGSVQAVYNVENRFIRFNVAPGADGLQVKVVYTSEFPVIVRRKHADSIAIFGEIHERIVRDPRPTRAEAEQIADAFLKQRALPVRPIQCEVDVFGLRPGIFVQVRIPSEGIDQLMPVVAVTRQSRPGQLDISVTLNQAPVTDEDAIFDLFKRLGRLEARETSRQQRVENYANTSDQWDWGEELEIVRFACPLPSEDLYPSEVLYPC